jgi:hypothetical protein
MNHMTFQDALDDALVGGSIVPRNRGFEPIQLVTWKEEVEIENLKQALFNLQ